MTRWLVVVALFAGCEQPVHERECNAVRELLKIPRHYDNDVFERLKAIPWQDPKLRELVSYATTADEPGAGAPYQWDATVTPRLRAICEL